MDRRYFFKASLAGGAALATGAATCPAQARDNKPLPSEALGLLFDSTLCVGCKACVAACKQANGMPLEFSTEDQYWDTPLDISGTTPNVIKAYKHDTPEVKHREENGFAFIKKSCMHCVDPSCVSACPVSAMKKDPKTGIVSYDKDACIGCRYCVAACPFGVPRFTYDSATPQISKCQLCVHRHKDGKYAACAEVASARIVEVMPRPDLSFPLGELLGAITPATLLAQLRRKQILGGVELGRWYPELSDGLLVCVTEKHSREDLDVLVAVVKEAAHA